MKNNSFLFASVCLFCLLISFRPAVTVEEKGLSGAWTLKNHNEEQVLLFADGYVTHTTYDRHGKKFVQSRGGTFSVQNGKLTIRYEFSTTDPAQTGQSFSYPFSLQQGKLTTGFDGTPQNWEQADDGSAGLAGLWRITARKEGDKLNPIHQTGTRKTIKILSSTRFQWAAIDPGTKGFMGTGGGTYEFADGKYIEHIEFFSRDSSRVGASLTFNGKLENGDWHHSGLSSRGDPIYEVWSRRK
jgi:hypothetical protein